MKIKNKRKEKKKGKKKERKEKKKTYVCTYVTLLKIPFLAGSPCSLVHACMHVDHAWAFLAAQRVGISRGKPFGP